MKRNGYLFILLILIFPIQAKSMIEKINYRGWSECYKIYNESTEIIFVAESGGRIMSYSIKGENIIYENHKLDGLNLKDYRKQNFDPDGGRFDWGPEKETRGIHDITWMGDYKAEIVDDYTLKLISPDDDSLGIRTIRVFSLDSLSSYLTIKNTMLNISDRQTDWFYWSRSLVKKGGTIILPLNPNSIYPHGWGKYHWDNGEHIEFENPIDRNLHIIDNTISYIANSGQSIKIATDSNLGWMAYIYENLIFIKKYKHFYGQNYTQGPNITSIFFIGDHFVELEPLSPQAILQPGEKYSFTEHWWLMDAPKFENSKKIGSIKQFIHRNTKTIN